MRSEPSRNPVFYSYDYHGLALPGRAADVTPNDSTDLTNPGVIFVGVGGDVKVDMYYGGTVTFKNIPSGSWNPGVVKRVYSTGTTATNLIVGY